MLHTPEHLHFEGSGRTPLAINVTPLIDCVFLLLVFFMLTTSFLEEQSLILHVAAPGKAAVTTEQLVVDIAKDGTIAVQGKPVKLDQLTATIRPLLATVKAGAVSIRAGRDVPVQRTVSVMDRIRAAGTENIKFLTRTGG